MQLAKLMVALGDLDDEATLARRPKPKLIERALELDGIDDVIPPELQFGAEADLETAKPMVLTEADGS